MQGTVLESTSREKHIIIYYLLGANWVPSTEGELQKHHTEADGHCSLGPQTNSDRKATMDLAPLITGNCRGCGTTKG